MYSDWMTNGLSDLYINHVCSDWMTNGSSDLYINHVCLFLYLGV